MTQTAPEAIVIGASAGAVEALSILLPALPASCCLPIMIVVHLPPDTKSILAELLQARSAITICEADDKQAIEPGTAYFAPPDYHLLVEIDRTLSLSSEEPVNYSRPSIDVLFETAADAYGAGLIGVVLTGSNADGAAGLRAVARAGGTTLVQSPEKAYARPMPEAALKACPDSIVLSLDEIKTYLQEVVTP